MRAYLWETHLHTSETSACGRASAADMVAAYKSAGFQGIVVTDHSPNANCVTPKSASWQRRIDGQLKGFKAAKEAGDALGLAVLLGVEFYHEGADYLTYGISEAFLRDQSDLCDIPIEEYARRVRAAGGFISQAHPYRKALYIPETVRQRWDIVDAVEVINGSHRPEHRGWDELADALAQVHGLLRTAGSDAHSSLSAGTAALSFSEAFSTSADFLSALRAKRGMPIRIDNA